MRRKLSFGRAGSQEFGKSKSSLSLDSVDREACLNRDRTVDKMSPKSQKGTPSSNQKSESDKSPNESQSKTDPKKENNEDNKPDPEDKKNDKGQNQKKGKKPSPAERTREYLRKKKLEKQENAALVKPKQSAGKAKASAKEGSEKAKKSDPKKKGTTAIQKPDEVAPEKKQVVALSETSKKGKGKGTEDPGQDVEVAATEKGKNKAHAMYMKFWRSTRSR